MKQAPHMRKLAYDKAIKNGIRVVTSASGEKTAAYTVTRGELMMIFENQGFNTDGVSWLNMICRWQKVGEYVPPESVVKNPGMKLWYVSPLAELTDKDIQDLKDYALDNNIGKVLIP